MAGEAVQSGLGAGMYGRGYHGKGQRVWRGQVRSLGMQRAVHGQKEIFISLASRRSWEGRGKGVD